ncbi:MAG TPA: phosphotransferase [Nocardiopsis listeri]|uniref:phosphotransferase n=1 Tax=Nocardiopsis listeri TaxID=53440 RepID=UPI001D5F1FC4|nr:phosphotransferase [Nocardiopsis listeri]HJE58688.1 phosphotransferase [Nocardiopsis listeri]
MALTHVPLGFGDHHWSATDAVGRRWFLTLADLEHKTFLGEDPGTVLDRLEGAMDTAARLRDDVGLGFVVAPLRSLSGATVHTVGTHHALSVFPHVEGDSGEFGRVLEPGRRDRLLDTLTALHRCPPPETARTLPIALEGTERLAALAEDPRGLGDHGSLSGAVADLLDEYGAALRAHLSGFGRRAASVDLSGVVTTHGEPHPGNLLWRDDRPLLVDWDTVGVAVPERDLWSVTDDPDALARYADVSGHVPDPDLLDLYRLRWDLRDVVEFVDLFGSPHRSTPDTEQALAELAGVLARLADRPTD